MSTSLNKTKKRCPNGERKNKITGICEPITDIKIIANDRRKTKYKNKKEIELPKDLETSVDIISPIQNKQKGTLRCPTGYHINRKTKKCHKQKGKKSPIDEPAVDVYTDPVSPPEPVQLNDVLPLEPVLQETVQPEDVLPLEPVQPETVQPDDVLIETVQPDDVLQETVQPDDVLLETDKNADTDIDIDFTPLNNKELQEKEKKEFDLELKTPNTSYDFLYPELNDPLFNVKIAKRKEFADTKYDGKTYDIKKQSDLLCNADFELMPHQIFVKNFLSFQTPYNSLLLYHGLGSGKTCSAIGIAEEMRSYMKQVGIKQRIIVVASPNVQSNFRLQLFDERKLKKISETEDSWSIQSCIGNSLLKEINPTQLEGLPKEKIISQMNSIINQFYIFMGYGQLVNFITKSIELANPSNNYTPADIENYKIKNIRRHFNNRLIIVDEVHNIRITDENTNKKAALLLMELAKHSDNMRLLFLSATPMYNSYKEIIWLTNLMNLNDKRSTIKESDVFDQTGEFVKSQKRKEGGKELLQRKLTGYISYVRGETPYVFPYRLFPKWFSDNTFKNPKYSYPTIQLNGKPITDPIQYVNVYLNDCGEYQEKAYHIMIQHIQNKNTISFANMESFGYTLLQSPLEALNIVYPNPALDRLIEQYSEDTSIVKQSNINMGEPCLNKKKDTEYPFVGSDGLCSIVNFVEDKSSSQPMRKNFEYKPEILENYGRIFSPGPGNIGLYSSKIENICNAIIESTGIVIVYSQYIDGGIIPIALALEERGFTRYCSNEKYKQLFKTRPKSPIDAITMNPIEDSERNAFRPASYIMITGDKSISPTNASDINYATNSTNKDGEQVKVILISRAGSEGLDFKNIRQIHILEPWYNMNRIEQIIGRGVRNLSHCDLPFEKRNVEIYMHSTILKNKEQEAADLYVYRFAEKKAIQIGKVSRVLKESSVDCILNIGQTHLTVDKLYKMTENQNIKIETSSGKQIQYKIGDESFSHICDYMKNCVYTCSPDAKIETKDIIRTTYNTDYIHTNMESIILKIKSLFREPGRTFYKRKELTDYVTLIKQYPTEQIYYALTYLIQNKNEYIYDHYGRAGNLINKGEYYIFQPIEINDTNASILERTAPVEFKYDSLLLEINPSFLKDDAHNQQSDSEPMDSTDPAKIIEKITENYNIVFSETKVEIKSGEKNWYKHANHVIEHIMDVYGISQETVQKFVIHHILDLMMFSEKFALFQYMDANKDSLNKEDVIMKHIIQYFKNKSIKIRNKEAILFTKDNVIQMFVKNNDRNASDNENDIDSENESEDQSNEIKWKESTSSENKQFHPLIEKFSLPSSEFRINDIIGFVNMFRNKEMVFKTKDTTQSRNNKGARCDNAAKSDSIKLLKKIIGTDFYKDTLIFHHGLCVIIEFIFRYRKETDSSKYYFFNPEETAINDIANL